MSRITGSHCAVTGPGFLLAAAMMTLRDTGVFAEGFEVSYVVFSRSRLFRSLSGVATLQKNWHEVPFQNVVALFGPKRNGWGTV